MIKIINHIAETLPGALLINEIDTETIIDICVKYHSEKSVSFILESIQDTFGYSGMVFASFILGQICAACQERKEQTNIFHTWQRPN